MSKRENNSNITRELVLTYINIQSKINKIIKENKLNQTCEVRIINKQFRNVRSKIVPPLQFLDEEIENIESALKSLKKLKDLDIKTKEKIESILNEINNFIIDWNKEVLKYQKAT